MKNSTWQRAKQIFDEAREVRADERAAYLDIHCSSDVELRGEVEKLLGSYDSDFLEETALDAAEALVKPSLTEGQIIGRYRIGKLIGSGGMGQVFVAEDTELGRQVAFKVLHHDVGADDERLRRFIQEARAASALNHPNILTIHEIGSFEGFRYIVSEYIDGETLRDRIRDGISTAESVDITCQIAAALRAAHSAGIVHRDIKPENVMLRQDGLVKVLDFGLAKLTEADDRPIDQSSPASVVETSPGLVMGTAAYMSPEQARGQSVDSRTDLWSLGVVFHEMLTGTSPFEGETVTELISSILKSDISETVAEDIPPELQPICRKALAKDKDSRYRSAHDLLNDLEGEKKRMEYSFQPSRYVSVSTTDELKTQLIRPRPTLSAEYIVTSVKRHKYATLAAAVIVATLAVGLSVYNYNGATPPDSGVPVAAISDSTVESDLRISKLPISSQAYEIVISPDGKYIAYLPGKGIRLLERETSVETEILPEGDIWGINFSLDGQYIYYGVRVAKPGPNAKAPLYKIPVRGGAPVPAIDNVFNMPAFSPDGTVIAFYREVLEGGERDVIFLANPDGSNERVLATAPYETLNYTEFAFSPDGKSLGGVQRYRDESGPHMRLFSVDLADGKQRSLSEKRWNRIWAVVWLPDGSLAVTAREKYTDPSQIWSVNTNGEARPLTTGLINYHGLSVTRRGDVLVSRQVKNFDHRDLWVYQGNGTDKGRQITNSGEVHGRFALVPDGRIVFSSDSTGNRELWVMNENGGGRKRLTDHPGGDVQPAISPDGKRIAFTSDRVAGVNQIFLMDIDGNNLKQLTRETEKILPSFSPDGKWIYFVEPPTNTVWKMSLDGGAVTAVAKTSDGWRLTGIDINSSDGRLVYGMQNWLGGLKWRVGILPLNGKPKVLDLPANLDAGRPRWAPDKRSLALLGQGNVWSFSVEGRRAPRRLTDFRTEGTVDPRWTPDNKQLWVVRGSWSSTPVLVQNTGN